MEIKIKFIGNATDHNLTCWLCEKYPAVYVMYPEWVFKPCWDCQKTLMQMNIKTTNWFSWFAHLIQGCPTTMCCSTDVGEVYCKGCGRTIKHSDYY